MPLFCQNCGHEHSAYVEICPRCGQRQPPLASAPASPVTYLPEEELRGVGGWLLLFCISLAILSPLMQAFIAAKALTNLASLPAPIGTFLRLGSVGAIYGSLAIFSCYAGILLWMERPKAVGVAKAYLVVGAMLPICLFLILYFAGVSVNVFQVIFRRSIYLAVWYTYLSTSRRVKLTYGTS